MVFYRSFRDRGVTSNIQLDGCVHLKMRRNEEDFGDGDLLHK